MRNEGRIMVLNRLHVSDVLSVSSSRLSVLYGGPDNLDMMLESSSKTMFLLGLCVGFNMAFFAGVPFSKLMLVTGLCLVLWYRRRLYIGLVTLPRDLKVLTRFFNIAIHNYFLSRRNGTVVTVFGELTAAHPNKPCVFFEDTTWTYKDVDVYSNRVANTFLNAGYKKGDTVALFMNNCPEYICIWLGLAKIGVVTALINTNLRLNPLEHCLNVAKVKGIIFSAELFPAIEEVMPKFDQSVELYQHFGTVSTRMSVKFLDVLLTSSPTTPPKIEAPGYKDKLLYIYTSGTTGLPKAAIMPHSRFLLMTMGAKYMLLLNNRDIMYDPLPLYHSAGGVLGVGVCLTLGISVVIKKKFSASNYFPDCIKYKCTLTQYIGEMCRYVLAVPPRPEDKQHRVRLMVGNGMRDSIWRQFKERFQIDQVTELYGATEGNTNIVNIDNTIGAVGCIPRILPYSLFPIGLVRVDSDTGEPVRGKNGLCIRCEVDEPGMFVGLISSSNAISEFHGYVDKQASSKKMLQNVFSKGDKAFLSGDILVMDEYGYLYFKDRTGDTFKWKGENVATAEVESVLNTIIGLRDATVYGVQVGELEGKAGMAAIVDPEKMLNLKDLAAGFDKNLPFYARPSFIRILDKMEMTGTFKIKKLNLQNEGFNPHEIKDDLYFRRGMDYIPLTTHIYEDIISGTIRL